MRLALAIAWCLVAATSASGQVPAPAQPAPSPFAAQLAAPKNIHPSVARIVAQGNGSVSYGSGTLIYADDAYGLVITNWHVINEATGPLSVHFPDGFYSLGSVQAVDRDWDLAAIVIKRPNASPVPVANTAPQPGELLTIAGYGSGTYRAASGKCTQYVAPGVTFPYEMVELAVSARQGDSGGPILNSRGELAGVLFGEGGGRTAGSYCGRVRWFLSSVVRDLPESSTPSTLIASAPLKSLPVRPKEPAGGPATGGPASRSPASLAAKSDATASDRMVQSPAEATPRETKWQSVPDADPAGIVASTQAGEPNNSPEAPSVQQIGWTDIAGETLAEQLKTILAAAGVLLITLEVLRWLSRSEATE